MVNNLWRCLFPLGIEVQFSVHVLHNSVVVVAMNVGVRGNRSLRVRLRRIASLGTVEFGGAPRIRGGFPRLSRSALLCEC